MKKRKVILIIIAVVVILTAIIASKIVSDIKSNLDQLTRMEISDVDLSQISDGTYDGSYEVFPIAAEVSVTVKNHQFTAIKLIKHDNGQGSAAETIPDTVLKTGSLKVDVVSGATYSSKVILKAIQNALNSATQ